MFDQNSFRKEPGGDMNPPAWAFRYFNFIRRLIDPKWVILRPYVKKDQVIADLGCGTGFHAFAMARKVGPNGKVYAVDSSQDCIRAFEKKIARKNIKNIETHATSAHDLSFIGTDSVDFVLAYGLLCSMAPKNRDAAVEEIKRILKPDGVAYFYADSSKMSYMTDEGWRKVLESFKLNKGVTKRSRSRDYWAEVSLKKEN